MIKSITLLILFLSYTQFLLASNNEVLVYKNRETVIKLIQENEIDFEKLDNIYKNDREIILLALAKDGYFLDSIDKKWTKDKELINIALKTSAYGLQYLEKEKRDDKNFVLPIIQRNPYALKYVSRRLKKDKELVKKALQTISSENNDKERNEIYQYIDQSLKKDKSFIKELLATNIIYSDLISKQPQKDKNIQVLLPQVDIKELKKEKIQNSLNITNKEKALQLLKDEKYWKFKEFNQALKSDREIAKLAVEKDFSLFTQIDTSLQQDKIFVKALLKIQPYIIKYLPKDLKNDRELLLPILKKFPALIKYVGESIKKDNVLMLNFVEKTGEGFKYLNEKQKKDKALILKIIAMNIYTFEYINKELQNNKAFILEILKDTDIYSLLSTPLQKDREIILEALKPSNAYVIFDSIPAVLLQDKTFIESAIQKGGYGFRYATVEQQDNRTLVIQALKLNPNAFKHIDKKFKRDTKLISELISDNKEFFSRVDTALQKDRIFVKTALKANGLVLEYLEKDLRTDKEFVLTALRENPSALQYVDNDLRIDKELIIETIQGKELFKYMDKVLLNDKIFMKRLKEVTGYFPLMSDNPDLFEKKNFTKSSLLKLTQSSVVELPYTNYKEYQLHPIERRVRAKITKNKNFLVSTDDKQINIWDVESGLIVKQIEGDNSIHELFLAEKSNSIISVEDFSIKLWDIRTAQLKTILYKSDLLINSVQISRNSKWLVFIDRKGIFRLLDINKRKIVRTFTVGNNNTSLDIDNDAKYLVMEGFKDKLIDLWSIKTGKKINTFFGHNATISTLRFSPSNAYMVSADLNGFIKIWDITSKKLLRTIQTSDRYISSLDINSKENYLLSTSDTIKVWDLKTAEAIKEFSNFDYLSDGRMVGSNIGYAYFINEGREIFSYSYDNSIKIRDIKSKKTLKKFTRSKTYPHVLSFSAKSPYLIVGLEDADKVAIWDMKKNYLRKVIQSKNNQRVTALTMSSDKKTLFVAYGWGDGGGVDISIDMWNIEKNKKLKSFVNRKKPNEQRENIYSLTLSPNNQYLASYFEDDKIELWQVNKKKSVHIFKNSNGNIQSSLVFSSDSKLLMAGTQQGEIHIWNVKNKKLLKTIKVSKKPIDTIAKIGDDLLIASGENIYLWSLKNKKSSKIFTIKNAPVRKIIVSQDKKLFLVTTDSSILQVWKLNQEKVLYNFDAKRDFNGYNSIVDISPDNKEIAIAFRDNSIKIFPIDKLGEANKILFFGDSKNWAIFDEKQKKLFKTDEGNFILKKRLISSDKNTKTYEIER